MVLQPLRQPILIGSVLGVIVSAINARVGFDVVPAFVRNPIGMIGDAAVPMILMAFGMSLRGARPLGSRSGRAAALTVVALKNLVMPAVAFAMAYWAMGVPRARAVCVRCARRAANRAERLQLRRQLQRGRRVFARLHPRQHHRESAGDRRDRARPRLVVGAGGDTGQTRRGAVRSHRAHQHERVTQRHSPDEADERAGLCERIAHERREQQQ